jgi:hypothetical protein
MIKIFASCCTAAGPDGAAGRAASSAECGQCCARRLLPLSDWWHASEQLTIIVCISFEANERNRARSGVNSGVAASSRCSW